MKKENQKKLSKFGARLVATWRLFWQQRAKLLLIAAIVVVPSSFARAYDTLATDLSILLTVAGFYCLLALIYFCHNMASAQKLSVARIYTSASGRFLQLVGVTITLSIALIPFIFAATLLVFVNAFGLPAWLYLPAVLVLIGSFVGVIGLGLSQFVVASEDVTAIGALKASWQRTKGVRVRLALQLSLFFGLLVVASGAVFFLVNLSSVLAESWFAQGITSSIVITPALAWLVVFGYSLYDEISE